MKNKIINTCKSCAVSCKEHCSHTNANYLTGILLLGLGAIDLYRGDYAFAASWAIFGSMYFAFESRKFGKHVGSYGGVIICIAIFFYYIKNL